MPERCGFDYALLRVVPHVERDEFINVGVVLFCPTLRFLAARVSLDSPRLAALAPDLDLGLVAQELALVPLICAGGAGAGALGELTQQERFHWLTSPRSTVVQVSPVHCGLCTDPAATLDELFQNLVGGPVSPARRFDRPSGL